jgi:hypothetical protein
MNRLADYTRAEPFSPFSVLSFRALRAAEFHSSSRFRPYAEARRRRSRRFHRREWKEIVNAIREETVSVRGIPASEYGATADIETAGGLKIDRTGRIPGEIPGMSHNENSLIELDHGGKRDGAK